MKVRGLSPSLPLRLDEQDGLAMNKSYKAMVAQNLKMLILTIPGERIMQPNFGVGLRKFLFEMNGPQTKGELRARIQQQLSLFMPFVEIVELNFSDASINPNVPENYLGIRLEYWVKPLEEFDVVELEYDLDKEIYL